VISRAELLLLINGIDRPANLDSLESLIRRGLVATVVDADSIVGLKTTAAGDSALRVVTLPASEE
jgi:hypothetical protein